MYFWILKVYILNRKIGIIGGGQLGKMILDETNKMGIYVRRFFA